MRAKVEVELLQSASNDMIIWKGVVCDDFSMHAYQSLNLPMVELAQGQQCFFLKFNRWDTKELPVGGCIGYDLFHFYLPAR